MADKLTTHYKIDASKVTPVGTGMGSMSPFCGPKSYDTQKILCIAKERHRDKGVHLLVAAFDKLRVTHPDATLTVIGGQTVAHELPVLPGLTLTARVSADVLANHFEQAAIYAMPASNEPWGLVYLEALAQRIPVLGLRRNALPEITRDGQYGFLIDDLSPDNIARQLAIAIESPNLLEQMGSAGKANTSEYYTWSKTAERMITKIEALL